MLVSVILPILAAFCPAHLVEVVFYWTTCWTDAIHQVTGIRPAPACSRHVGQHLRL